MGGGGERGEGLAPRPRESPSRAGASGRMGRPAARLGDFLLQVISTQGGRTKKVHPGTDGGG